MLNLPKVSVKCRTNLLCQIPSELMRVPNKKQRVTPGTKSLRMRDAGTVPRIPKIRKLLHVVLKTLVKKKKKQNIRKHVLYLSGFTDAIASLTC